MANRVATRFKATDDLAGRNGVTIIECLVAIVVLSFGLYGAAELVTASRRNGQMASWRAEAAGMAALKLEELRLAAPQLADLLSRQGETTGALTIPDARAQRILPQNKRLAWKAIVVRAKDDPARLDIAVEITRSARLDEDLPIIAKGVAYLPTWPDAKAAAQ